MKDLKEKTLNQWLKMSEEKREEMIFKSLENAPFELNMLIEKYLENGGNKRYIKGVILNLVIGFSFVEIAKLYNVSNARARTFVCIGIHRLQHPLVCGDTMNVIRKRDTIDATINACLINL